MGEMGLHAPPIDLPIDQDGQVQVAHRAEIALDVGAK